MKTPFSDVRREGPPGPLSGVRVLDVSAYIAGPYGCTLLADQGAEGFSASGSNWDSATRGDVCRRGRRSLPSTFVSLLLEGTEFLSPRKGAAWRRQGREHQF